MQSFSLPLFSPTNLNRVSKVDYESTFLFRCSFEMLEIQSKVNSTC